jgi:hypothetical protein
MLSRGVILWKFWVNSFPAQNSIATNSHAMINGGEKPHEILLLLFLGEETPVHQIY